MDSDRTVTIRDFTGIRIMNFGINWIEHFIAYERVVARDKYILCSDSLNFCDIHPKS
jgi:hypothetical protein